MIVLDQLTKCFGAQTAVDALSFEIPAGQIIGFLVHIYSAPVKCSILSWHALMGALKGEAKPVTTESENN